MRQAIRAGMLAGAIALAAAPGAQAEQQQYVEGEAIVQYAPSAAPAAKERARRNARVTSTKRTVRGSEARVVEVEGSVERAVGRLSASEAVLYAEPNYVYHAFATPNDPLYAQQDDLHNVGQRGGTTDADIDAPEAWDLPRLSAFPQTGGTKIGIVDTGIDRAHPDLQGRTADCGGVNNFGRTVIIFVTGADPTIVDGKCNDDNQHGTHVAGTIAANTNNAIGMAGVAFDSPLAICKGLNASGSGTLEMIANCVTWLNQRGATVISMSLGGTSSAATLQNAVRNATANGSLIIAASGNGGNSTPNYPAAYPEVVSVAATDNRDQRASFSTYNADVEIAAPGVDTLSTVPGGGYARFSGTSMATPHVAGVAGLIKTQNPAFTVDQLRARLLASVDDLGTPGRDPQFGWGRVNTQKALTP